MTKSPPPQNEDTFHRARSRFIDSFAKLECRTVLALKKAGWPIKRDTLGSKLKTIREATKSGVSDEITPVLERISQLNDVRADIVHGVMLLVDIDGVRFASFRNAADAINEVQRPAHISYKDLKKFADELDCMAEKIATLSLTPPFSPPPPLPAAAGGP